ncbi:MAG: hypothetical protein ACJAUH_002107 [Saprospiraceae bacterium]|jgi:hypothetical protein
MIKTQKIAKRMISNLTGFKNLSGFAVFTFLFFINNAAFAQINDKRQTREVFKTSRVSNLRVKYFTDFKSDTLYLDTLTILPNSLIIRDLSNNKFLDSMDFKLENNYLLNQKKTAFAKLEITYRVFPFDIGFATFRKDSTWRGLDEGDRIAGFEYNPYANNQGIIEAPGLSYNGSFERGIAFGNNQDLVVNSNFNLQMAGKLGDDIEILGAISDNNIPLQAEGNTQQLNEFDRLFIQIKRKNVKLTAGDYELKRPNAYFLNYYKKLQGLTFESNFELGKGTLTSSASAAISRGKFGRNTLATQEGNQGPYKLLGNDGELFIIVLSGTERVFLDGQLLTRGQENDYIIDYNRGELRFTANRLITKDVRILVEFEYTNNEYQRSLLALNLDYKTDKLRLNLNAYNEQDGRTPTVQGALSEVQQLALANISDATGSDFVTSVDTAEFRSDRILYKMIDTLINGFLFDSILVYSTNQNRAIFEAVFSQVGLGNGNYIRLQSSANGTVFQWVSPDFITGKPTGTHEPIVKLVAPNRQQMLVLGGEYQLTKSSKVWSEIALSNRDLNRLSAVQGKDNLGLGFNLGYENRLSFGKKDSTKIKKNELTLNANYEFIEHSFNPLNPYRGREFTRDWNVTGLERTDEHIVTTGFTFKRAKVGTLQYNFSTFLKDSLYNGFRNYAVFVARPKNWDIRLEMNYLNTNELSGKSTFFRPKINISKTFEKLNNWQIGAYAEREKNQRFGQNTDTLSGTSFYYDVVRGFIKSPQKNDLQLTFNYQERTDFLPKESSFREITKADELNLQGEWKKGTASNLRLNLTYRNLNIIDSTLTNIEPQTTYLGRIEYALNLKKGLFRANTTYEIGSGQEQKIQFNYIQVEAGQGTYTWIDRNQDSLKQVDEFELAAFQDQANHIRIATFTNEFIRTNTVRFNQSVGLNPKAIWYKEKGVRGFLARFATQSAWQINRKVLIAPDVVAWNPFQTEISDTALVSLTANVRHSLFFNRTNPKFGGEVGYFNNGNRVILTTGFESRSRQETYLNLRWNITKAVNFKIKMAFGTLVNDSEIFNTRDYAIDFQEFEPEISLFAFDRTLRTSIKYRYKNSLNTLENTDESATANEGKLELTYNKARKSSYRLNFSYVNVNFTGTPNTPVEFTMLEGLKNGQNFIWNLTFNRSIARNIQLLMTYEGRKTGEANVIHVGRASVRASF